MCLLFCLQQPTSCFLCEPWIFNCLTQVKDVHFSGKALPGWLFWTNGSPSVVRSSVAAAAAPELEMQSLWSHPRPTEGETLRVGPNQSSKMTVLKGGTYNCAGQMSDEERQYGDIRVCVACLKHFVKRVKTWIKGLLLHETFLDHINENETISPQFYYYRNFLH